MNVKLENTKWGRREEDVSALFQTLTWELPPRQPRGEEMGKINYWRLSCSKMLVCWLCSTFLLLLNGTKGIQKRSHASSCWQLPLKTSAEVFYFNTSWESVELGDQQRRWDVLRPDHKKTKQQNIWMRKVILKSVSCKDEQWQRSTELFSRAHTSSTQTHFKTLKQI